MNVRLDEARMGARLLADLPRFLRRPLTTAEARATVRRRLEGRQQDFLALARQAIYENPLSPYRALLQLAGCEHGDLERLVRHDGVEGALATLLRAGVYLTVDEFKGRRPVRRGSATIEVTRRGLRNPASRAHIVGLTSGSRGARAPVPIALPHLRDWAVDLRLDLEARGIPGPAVARWTEPGGGAIAFALNYEAAGAPLVRWFTPVDVAAASGRLHPRYRWSVPVLSLGYRLAGRRFPHPEHVSPDDPARIVRWLAEVTRSGRAALLVAYVSGAVRVAQAAVAMGVDLTGAYVDAAGEPITAARAATIRRAGLGVIPLFTSVDTGWLGRGCLAPDEADDVHLFHDLHAMIQAASAGAAHGLPGRALLLSSLRSTAPLVLLNVSLGDAGAIVERACGCALEQAGWPRHLVDIRSFEKLTAGGTTFMDTDVARVLEEVLPARFGGAPTDYQLVEEEGAEGLPVVRVLVHPRVGAVDPEGVVAALLDALGEGGGAERLMALRWRDSRLLRVERRAPILAPSGKILHLHVAPRPAP